MSFEYFFIEGKGLIGYLRNIRRFRRVLKDNKVDMIHAHYGASGLVAIFQKKIPVVVTFHGSDINIPKLNLLSTFVSLMSYWRIFVSEKLYTKIFVKPSNNFSIIPCGISFEIFRLHDKNKARASLGLSEEKKYILFGSSFDNPIKNFPLAKEALDMVHEKFELLELKNRSREDVCLLFNACDMLLLTSKSEGSPQVIKEALACNCPIVATNVGNINEIVRNVSNCYVVEPKPDKIAEKVAILLGEEADKWERKFKTVRQ